MGRFNLKALHKLATKRIVTSRTYWEMRKLLKKKNLRASYKLTASYTVLLFQELIGLEIVSSSQKYDEPRFFYLSCCSYRLFLLGKEGLCILLRRLSYPNKLSDLVSTFNRDEGTISRIFNYMLKWMYNHHANRLHSLKQNYLTRQELEELAENSSANGCPYPNIIGYIDGTCRSICRPKYNQRDMYSGYKKKHVTKYQNIVLTNGLIGRLDGPFIGRRHDAGIVHLSKLLQEMKTFLTKNDGTYWAVYGDAGYSNQKYIKVGFKNFKTLNRKEKEFNRLMSSLRVGVEYGFGQVIQQFAFLDYKKTQKLYLSPLKEMFYVSAFLVNCQTSLRGKSQISDIFNSYVPTLEEYLS